MGRRTIRIVIMVSHMLKLYIFEINSMITQWHTMRKCHNAPGRIWHLVLHQGDGRLARSGSNVSVSLSPLSPA